MKLINHTSISLLFLHYLTTLPFLTFSLTPDGLSLLSLKSAITPSPAASSAFADWNESDNTPCKWLGITCSKNGAPRVISVTLANRGLTGYIPSELGSLTSLRRLNLHTNHFTGPIPSSLFNATSLHSLFLYSNNLSGSLPSSLCNPARIQNVDVSHNNLTSPIPHAIGQCQHLQRLIVSHNQLSDKIPSGVWSAMGELVQLDLSSNRLTGKIPVDLGELKSLSGTLNLSFNHLTGRIPKSLGNLPMTVSFDLRGNNLTGEIPQTGSFASQGPTAFINNPLLCGFPLQKSCGDNASAPSTQDLSGHGHSGGNENSGKQRNRLDAGTIVLISAADAAVVAFVGLIIIYVYWKKKDDSSSCSCTGTTKLGGFGINHHHNDHNKSSSHPFLCCINGLITNPASPNSDSEISSPEKDGACSSSTNGGGGGGAAVPGGGELVALDKSFSFELDELLRASAYVLGKSGLGIVYKVVLGNGIPVAVRRLGEGGGDQQRYKEFVAEVNAIAKVKHPNVVRLRAYYWAPDEKLLISDFVSNGNLANALKGKTGQSTTSNSNLTWSTRLKIAKGTSKGLAYLHECSPRKFVHGDIKPSNILLDADYQPYISDFGLNRLITITGSDPSSSGGLMGGALPYIKPTLQQPNPSYKAPEARFPGTRPTQKWDVYSFGVVLLEMLTGKSCTEMMISSSSPRASSSSSSVVVEVMSQQDLVKWVRKGFEDQIPLSEMVDPTLLNEVKAKKEVLTVFHVALACTESDPEIRPRMKNVAENLEKIGGS